MFSAPPVGTKHIDGRFSHAILFLVTLSLGYSSFSRGRVRDILEAPHSLTSESIEVIQFDT
jgi:hypothetical protein